MKNKVIGVLLTLAVCVNALSCIGIASALSHKPDVKNFAYTLTDKDGVSTSDITPGGVLDVSMILENHTDASQSYIVMLQILKNGSKVSIKSVEGEVGAKDEEPVCLSDAFPETETDFSEYSAEVYLWSDMTSMQPISTYSVFGSDNNDIYAYKIDNEVVYTKGETFTSYYFNKEYTGVPKVKPIFYDLGVNFDLSPSIDEVTTERQNYTFGVTSQLGNTKDSYLELYKITDETDPKNADLKSVKLPMGAYNANYNTISTLYPAFNKDVTEYKVASYTKTYSGLSPVFETVNPDATVALTTAPDTTLGTTTAVYTVTSADGTVTKDYTFNYVGSNNSSKRLYITAISNIYRGNGKTCLVEWNGHVLNNATPSKAKVYLMDGIYNRSETDRREIKSTDSIIEIDIAAGPAIITDGVLRLSLGQTYPQAPASGTVHVHKINESIYDLDSISSIPTGGAGDYLGDELCAVNVEKLTSNNGDMYLINIGAEYYNSLKEAGRTKMYIGLSPEVHDPEKGFSAVFGAPGSNASGYANSCFDYITE